MRRSIGYGLLVLLLCGCQGQTQSRAAEPSASGAQAAQTPSGPPKEFKLEGEIISVDPDKKAATVKHGPIEGYMAAMTMSYPIPDSAELAKIKAGDHITATVFDDQATSKYWLGNIQVGAPAAK